MHIKNLNTVTPFTSPHGEIIHEYLGSAAGGSQYHSLAQITLPPGTASVRHYHPTAEESYYILSGTGRVELNGENQNIQPGDAVAIPANTVHQIFNISDMDLIFLAVCVPAWTPQCSVMVD